MDLKEKVRNLPLCPGIYFMKDSLGNVIYVGKSKCLKKRVQSYFYNSKAHSTKVQKLVKNLKDFDFIITDTEFEALMMECKYIKKLKPTYNRLMKSPLSYIYIKIETDKTYPNIDIVSFVDDDNSLYFGPFTNKNLVEKTVLGIKDFYKILCNNPSKRSSSCLNYFLGKCIGMCSGDSVSVKYQNVINKIIGLFQGTDMDMLKEIKQEMLHASENLDFETAAKYRDIIDSIKVLISKERVVDFAEKNRNIVMIERLDVCIFKLFLIKRNKILFSTKYNFNKANIEQILKMIKTNILDNFKPEIFNDLLEITKDEIDEADIIYSYLKNNKCKYTVISQEWLAPNNIHNIDDAIFNLLNSV
ncbi:MULTISPECIES: GIY-YIG nuclease family protein [Clostridium]|uniref:UvrABC system protein C n=2 Tax=Clostridium TaxID=1485 RepID=A0A151AKB5_9CLOT|nr:MULTISPECIES: GIY-YIG nuclease family protein [Clostridium]KYH28106.1 UvrABC system protein C [Clostridium colicanis DSM 13634]MBE6043053.1 DNA helicase UvrC [Clostridium thermopalmarium]PRR70519.1 UvrABC system protein C [Clostridium thermopalmarium DSM 5974]PVZ21292.1 excinuclease ABC subunit C [Clostridium thermopalmarium DSM 5974]